MSYVFPTNCEIDKGFTFGMNWDEEAYRENRFRYPNVCYKYLQMEGTYGFNQKEWDYKDAVAYFESMNILAQMPISDFQELDKQEWHMYPNHICKGRNLHTELLKVFSEEILNKPELLPPFFHFALYQDKGVIADRRKKVKSPRIYFFIGDNAAIYPIFYDPYHELNPQGEEKD